MITFIEACAFFVAIYLACITIDKLLVRFYHKYIAAMDSYEFRAFYFFSEVPFLNLLVLLIVGWYIIVNGIPKLIHMLRIDLLLSKWMERADKEAIQIYERTNTRNETT